MHMIKKYFLALCAVVFSVAALAQSGLSCDDAITLTEDYRATISGPCELWYTASTYDLPIHVYFNPRSNNSEKGPSVEIDFTCTPGVYEDKLIDSLVNLVSDFSITFPVKLESELVTGTGRNEWDLSVSKTYREQLAAFGILYSVRAYVKVTYYEAGTISMTPDTAYASCVSEDKIVSLDDTLSISANDEERVFVFPYTTWKNDSIRFVWTGEQPATIYVAEQDCQFMADTNDPYVFSSFVTTADEPHKLYTEEMKHLISNHVGEGIFYAKVIAPVNGKLVVEKIPMAAAAGGAEMLEYGQSVQVTSGDQLYCFPRTWAATELIAQGAAVQMLVSATADFTPSAEDANVISAHDFVVVDGKPTLQFSTVEMNNIISAVTGDYVYVRFLAENPVIITPSEWLVSDCVDDSYLILPNKAQRILAKSSKTVYRLRYSDFTGYDLTIKWTGANTLPTYIAEICDFSLSTNNAALLVKPAFTIARKGSKKISSSTIETWESRIGDDGFFYVRFNPSVQGDVTFDTEKPLIVEPEIPEVPVDSALLNTVELKVGSDINVALDSVFTIYRINYAEWLATGATLTWTGSEPLHVFVAETYQFAVAPYNKYVHAYVPVPAGGGVVFDKNMLEALKDKVGENGYLYVRLLTEFPGKLTVK